MNFSASQVLTFGPSSNLTLYVTIDLRGVSNVESLNLAIELPEGIAATVGQTVSAMLKPFSSEPSGTIKVPIATSSIVIGKSIIC